MKPLREIRRARQLYQTDSRVDTIFAVVLVGTVAYPFLQVWWKLRKGGEETYSEG